MQMNCSVTIERKRNDCNNYYGSTGKRNNSNPRPQRTRIPTAVYTYSEKMIQQLSPPSISLYRCSNSNNATSSGAEATKLAGDGANNSSSCGEGGNSSANITSSSTSNNNALKRRFKNQQQISAPTTGGGNPTSSTSSTSSNSRQQLEFSRTIRTDSSLVPPIRQTASIFKQPVTVVRNFDVTKVKNESKQSSQEKPKQMFWEKRLEHLRACHATGDEFDDIALPKSIKTIGPNVDEQTALQSLATALHVLNTPVTGQTSTKTEMTKNATAFINPDQPLMQAVLVNEDDIRRQEERVNAARKKLQDALTKC